MSVESALYGGQSDRPGGRVRRVNVNDLANAKSRGERWPMITCYDALTAGLFDESGDADLRYRLHVQQAGGGVQECGAAALHARVDWLGCAGGTHGSSVSQTC